MRFVYVQHGGYAGTIRDLLVVGTDKDEVARESSRKVSTNPVASVKAYLVQPEQVPEILTLLYDNNVLSLTIEKPPNIQDSLILDLSFVSSHYSHNARHYNTFRDDTPMDGLMTSLKSYLQNHATEIHKDTSSSIGE